jgi:hypothetical protein
MTSEKLESALKSIGKRSFVEDMRFIVIKTLLLLEKLKFYLKNIQRTGPPLECHSQKKYLRTICKRRH